MKFNLSKTEIKVLGELCSKDRTVTELSDLLGAKTSFISRILVSLDKKWLIDSKRDGKTKIISLSKASHAQRFKILFETRKKSNIEKWLSGYAISILVIASNGADMKLLFEEAGCSKTTLYKTIDLLASLGAISKKDTKIEVSDNAVLGFARSYANNIQLVMQKEANSINTSIRVRKHIVLRTDAQAVPTYFIKTGVASIKNFEGIVTLHKDYYFDLDTRIKKLSDEEKFIHAVIMASLQRHQDMPVLEVFFAKNFKRFDIKKLKSLAKRYLVENIFEQLLQKQQFYSKMREFE